jgi:OOP family OmpA-OmpF porin
VARAEGLVAGASVQSTGNRGSLDDGIAKIAGVGLAFHESHSASPSIVPDTGALTPGHPDDASGQLNTRVFPAEISTYVLAPRWSLLGSGGAANARLSATNGDDEAAGLKVGAGLQYEVTRRLALRVEYDHYHIADAFDARPSIGTTSLGFKVGF